MHCTYLTLISGVIWIINSQDTGMYCLYQEVLVSNRNMSEMKKFRSHWLPL